MKILLLAPQPFFQHRGTPIAVRLMAEVLADEGHEIGILTYHEGEDVEIRNAKIYRIPSLPGLKNIRPGPSWKKLICDSVMFLYCLKIACRVRFDLVHAVEESAFMAVAIKALFRIPFVYDMDSSLAQQIAEKYKLALPLGWLFECFEKMAVRSSLGVIAVCKSLEETASRYASNKLIQRLEDISLLESGAEGGDFLTEKLGIDGPIIMYVGNLEKYQGLDLLLESFTLAAGKVPEAQLVIVGGTERDIRRYERVSKVLQVADRTHFIGQRPISQLGFYLEQADVLVSPRLQGQNTPMKIYSYLDSGKPLIATRLPTHTQVLDDQIALLVNPDPHAMADGLISLLEDRTFATDLAQRAKERVKQELSYEAFQKKLVSFYRSLETTICCGQSAYSGR
jgi:glycosyltransferase involved in cell wall biosynthesis